MSDRQRNAAEANIERVFQALGDATRRAMVDMLGVRPHSVSGLAEPLGITLTAVAQHLQVLEEAGLVRTEKVGRVRTCRIDTAGFDALAKWARERRPELERKLDRLGEMLE
jgi:DNA-binding transcriptional ArsR family regulator